MSFFKNLYANLPSVTKWLTTVAGIVITGIATHNWTAVPNDISYVVSALVFLLPNAPKSAPAPPPVSPPVA
jgi:hypothetical protein